MTLSAGASTLRKSADPAIEAIMNKLTGYVASAAAATIGVLASLAAFKPRPTQHTVTTRTGDDTVVVNQSHDTRLSAMVLDQYGRLLRSDTSVRFQRLGGDTISVSSGGRLRCEKHSDVVMRAEFETLSKRFVLRCRPVAWIEAPSWIELMVGDSAQDLAFVAHGPDGRRVTELRGTVRIENSAIVAAAGTTVRATGFGMTFANIAVGDASTSIPIGVYEPVTSFVNQPPKQMMGIRVKLARGDTIDVAVPKGAFWVTYYSDDRSAAPPTIELRGNGACSTGDGVRMRRLEQGTYAKYCRTGDGVQMMIAHGAIGADTVSGLVAVRMMWR
jgi:hypothetical protein